MRPKKLSITIILILSLFILINLYNVNASSDIFLDVKREIIVNPAHLIVKDEITVLNKTDRIPVYLSEYEYVSLYTIWVKPQKPIQWGLLHERKFGFYIIGNFEAKSNITLYRIYDDKIFLEENNTLKIQIPAYFLTEYNILNGSTKVFSPLKVSSVDVKSPEGANITRLADQTFSITYSFKNINGREQLANTTDLIFSFKLRDPTAVPWIKIEKMVRKLFIEGAKLRIEDEVILKYAGRGEKIEKWIPNILPKAKLLSARDQLGDLEIDHSKEEIKLRNPLLPIFQMGTLKATLFITSEINLNDLGYYDSNSGNFNFKIDVLEANPFLIDYFELIITNNFISSLTLDPQPDEIMQKDNFIQYKYVRTRVFSEISLTIKLEGKQEVYLSSLTLFVQILVIVFLISVASLIYFRYFYLGKPLTFERKIPLLEDYLTAIESILLDYEEIDKLGNNLKKGLINKQEFNLRMNNLKKDIISKEREVRNLSKIIKQKHPEIVKSINEIENYYNALIKEIKALQEENKLFELRKIPADKFKKIREERNKAIKNYKGKIDSLIAELREKYK
ncbi:MAG: hypothetical protein RQ922_03215 [Thermoproteota archaeon]|nr:hypothetical protein [Thermoproteota archaeon]